MAITLLQTVEQSIVSTPKTHYIWNVLKVISLLIVCALVIFSAELVNACEKHADKVTDKRDPAAIESISISKNTSCDFNCTANTDTSGDLYACERAQQRCEFNGHLPLNTQKVGRN